MTTTSDVEADRAVREVDATPTGKRGVALNSAFLLFDKVFRVGGNLALTIWMARSVGPEEFGGFSFATATTAIASALGTLGLQSVLMRDLNRESIERQGQLILAALSLRVVAAVALIALAAAGTLALRGFDQGTLLATVLALSVLPQAFDVFEWFVLAKEQAPWATLVRAFAFVLTAAGRVAIIITSGSIPMFAALIVLEAVLGAAGCYFAARRVGMVVKNRFQIRTEDLSDYLEVAAPLVASALFVQIYMRLDQILIAQWLGDGQAGLYAAAIRISEAWNFVPAAALVALAPRLTRAHQRSDAEFIRQLSRVVRVLASASFAFALIVHFTADPLVRALYGEHYTAAVSALRLHVFSGVFATIGLASAPYFVNHGLFRVAMILTIFGAFVNVALNVLLIPRMGINGAALAAVIAQFVSSVALNACFVATRPLARMQARCLFGSLLKSPRNT